VHSGELERIWCSCSGELAGWATEARGAANALGARGRILGLDNPKESFLRPTFAAPGPVINARRMRFRAKTQGAMGNKGQAASNGKVNSA
jgi:hypothetical protein